MTVLDPPVPRRRGVVGLVEKLSGVLEQRTSRRGFLARSAVVGSALAVGPVQYALKPGTAYAAVCGTDSSCSTGYTVFCATINGGVNRCPPNALVGGWWKADNSGFCCGSARYYIDCHSYCSCGCSGGNAFCGEGCRSCSCGCGPASSCDQRRVCCNNFRYGQCMQNVSCTGPVWCRVVTCTPPWQVAAWSCSTTSATDARTGQHTAPGLPNCTAIDSFYTALGGPGSFLGEARTGERGLDGGAYTEYDRGSVYWSPGTGAHEVHGAIRDTWVALGAERGPLGYPITSERTTGEGGGRYNDFRGPAGVGSVLWRSDLGAHGVWGQVRERWLALGADSGPLGYPTTSERVTADGSGRFNDFLGRVGPGSVYWRTDVGAHEIWGDVRRTWLELGGVTGPLAFPTSGELASRDGRGRYQTFVGRNGLPGSVHWSPATGAHGVWGLVRRTWLELGGEDGPVGRPVTSELVPGDGRGRYNDFVGDGTPRTPGASVYWSPGTGAHLVSGRIRAAWLEVGGSGGRLGYPTTGPRTLDGGRIRSTFQGGAVTFDPATGRTTVTYD